MTAPTLVLNQSNLIYFELSPGKKGKDGKITIQKEQKGQNSLFYATKRILTTAQIRSEHGRACSLRRKTITSKDALCTTVEAILSVKDVANRHFLEKKGKDPEKTAQAFLHNTLVQAMSGLPAACLSSLPQKWLIDEAIPPFMQMRPRFWQQQMDAATEKLIAQEYGLKMVPLTDMTTIQKLIVTLAEKGPLVMNGKYGQAFYANTPAVKFSGKVAGHKLFGWRKDAPKTEVEVLPQAIVVVGAEIKNSGQFVYYVNPMDASDPTNPETQKIYVTTFTTLIDRLATCEGRPINWLDHSSKQSTAGAYYNPDFFPKAHGQ